MRARLLLLLFSLLIAAVAVEVGFRVYLRLTGETVHAILPRDEVLARSLFEPHPHLLYVFKPERSFRLATFGNARLTTNRHGFRSTLRFDVTGRARPDGALRVVTFGGSTTMGVNDDDEVWPYRIGEGLERAFPGRKIEVLNEGTMGYTSLDNLLDLASRVAPFECDVYVLYLGVNDMLSLAPLDAYRRDAAHFRRTLHESLDTPAARLPRLMLRSAALRRVLQALGHPDSRDLTDNTVLPAQRQAYDALPDDARARVEARVVDETLRNVRSMIGIIRASRPQALIVLSSFFDQRKPRFIEELNRGFRDLAARMDVAFVDLAARLPREPGITYDYGHFTEAGDRMVGAIFAEAIATGLADRAGGPPELQR